MKKLFKVITLAILATVIAVAVAACGGGKVEGNAIVTDSYDVVYAKLSPLSSQSVSIKGGKKSELESDKWKNLVDGYMDNMVSSDELTALLAVDEFSTAYDSVLDIETYVIESKMMMLWFDNASRAAKFYDNITGDSEFDMECYGVNENVVFIGEKKYYDIIKGE